MTHVITDRCVMDGSCVEVCPVDCILPARDDSDFEIVEQLYIDPGLCIDCGSCVSACPIDVIRADFEVADDRAYAIVLNASFFEQRTEG